MPSGKTHDRINATCFLPFAAAAAYFLQEAYGFAACCAGFIFASFMFGPDLDTHSIHYKRWGMLRFVWLPYRHFGGHRAFLNQSHDALFGPVLRFLYLLFLLLAVLCIVLGGFCVLTDTSIAALAKLLRTYANVQNVQESAKFVLLFFLGTWLASLVHHLSDWFYALYCFTLGKIREQKLLSGLLSAKFRHKPSKRTGSKSRYKLKS